MGVACSKSYATVSRNSTPQWCCMAKKSCGLCNGVSNAAAVVAVPQPHGSGPLHLHCEWGNSFRTCAILFVVWLPVGPVWKVVATKLGAN